jgi:high-affinity Fe2+/Pb2+ permease
VPDEGSPLQHLNRLERRLLGWMVLRMFAADSPRFARALAETGPIATARMACVNTLRVYAIGLFLIGLVGELARTAALAYPFMALAALCVLWSCWCLYTVVGPERAYKAERSHAAEGRRPSGLDVFDS